MMYHIVKKYNLVLRVVKYNGIFIWKQSQLKDHTIFTWLCFKKCDAKLHGSQLTPVRGNIFTLNRFITKPLNPNQNPHCFRLETEETHWKNRTNKFRETILSIHTMIENRLISLLRKSKPLIQKNPTSTSNSTKCNPFSPNSGFRFYSSFPRTDSRTPFTRSLIGCGLRSLLQNNVKVSSPLRCSV